ncbi:DUF2384 domain-containing protein [Qipengyuania soli]|uniref:DUF2384 domain-containing protein n=1 Tax=Qipengyuania soli TaxID=2782568 RepID=A0A7S8F5H1_9SPHN|nr:DUF2384 domain-containing protein [Qipengyuania soli]
MKAAHASLLLGNAARERRDDTIAFAMSVMSADEALAFMNSANAVLGGRPIDLVMASERGRRVVRAHLSVISLSGT